MIGPQRRGYLTTGSWAEIPRGRVLLKFTLERGCEVFAFNICCWQNVGKSTPISDFTVLATNNLAPSTLVVIKKIISETRI